MPQMKCWPRALALAGQEKLPLDLCLQVFCPGAAEGEVGGPGGAWPQGEGGAEPADPEEPPAAAGEPAAQVGRGSV